MWFGLHPLGAVIAFIVLRWIARPVGEVATLAGRVVCTRCRRLFAGVRGFSLWWGLPKYDCPHCRQPVLHPFHVGWMIALWLLLGGGIAGAGVQIANPDKPGPSVAYIVTFYVVPFACAVVSDLVVRLRVRAAEREVPELRR